MRRSRVSTLKRRDAVTGLLFISPWLIGFLAFFIGPMIKTVQFSFGEVTFGDNGYIFNWTGIDKYDYIFTDDVSFLPALASTLGDIATSVPIILVFSFFIALLLKKRSFATNLAKGIFFLPVIMSSGVFLSYQNNNSSINQVIDSSMEEVSGAVTMLSSQNMILYLEQMGLPEEFIGYITGPIDNIYNVVMLSGVQIFIFLAGLNSISPSLYEACYIEGGGPWETFWKITFPMMTPSILVNTVFSLVDTFTSESNEVMNQVYTLAFSNFQFGLSSAMCLIYVTVLAVIMAVTVWLIGRRTFYYT
ncbi:MAG: sugar ABC transporter permease [Clostridia bacterium]|nr:sugar ABC transporter permease [Clostridia bacterium]